MPQRLSWPAGFRRLDPVLLDVLVGVVLLAAIELQLWQGSRAGALPALGGVVVAVAVAVRRRWPLAGIVVLCAVLLVKTALGSGQGALKDAVALVPALMLLFYGAGAFASWRRSRCVVGVALSIAEANMAATSGANVGPLLFAALFVVVVPFGLGRLSQVRATRARADLELAEQLDAGSEREARVAAREERVRIARELHDVVAHSVSVMVIQAGGARLVLESDPDRAEAALRSVERAGREALAEMRRLLGLLGPDEDSRALEPQPGLADVAKLLTHARSSGLRAELRVDGTPLPLPPALDLCAYRIVQEALTNAIKHAGPAHAEINLRWTADTLELEISDDGRGPASGSGTSGGHGIAGMRERVAVHGGSVYSGAGAEGGFTIRARLPVAQGAAA